MDSNLLTGQHHSNKHPSSLLGQKTEKGSAFLEPAKVQKDDVYSAPLPLHHDEYRYPPSRHPYVKQLKKQEGFVFIDDATENYRGNWRSQFKNLNDSASSPNRPLHVEIGCNAGHVLVEWANAHPENLYIGLDWKFKSIFRAAEKAQKRNLKNTLFLRGRAERLPSIFGEQEIDFLYLYFPDPWVKNSQMKNRFFTSERLIQIAKLMRPGGIFHVKTDHREYFNTMLKAIEKSSAQWTLLEMSMNLHEHHPAPQTLEIPDVTLFEKIFIRDQLPIYSLKLQSLL